MYVLPIAIYRFNAIPAKIPMTFFTEIKQKFNLYRAIKTQNSKAILREKRKKRKRKQSWGYHAPWFQIILQSFNNKNSMTLAEKQLIVQRNRIEDPGKKPYTCGQLIYNKRGKNLLCKKDSLSRRYCWENWIVTSKRVKLDCYLTPHTKINWRCIKELNVRLKS